MYSVDENHFYCLKRGHKVFFFLQFIVIASSGTVVMLAYLDSLNPTGRNTN